MDNIFLQLLQPFPCDRPLECTKEELSALKSESMKHNLLMLTYSQLKKYREEYLGNGNIFDFLEEIKPLCFKSTIISKLQETIEKEIISLLNERNIPAVVIKGNTIAQEIYNDPICRTSSDIDILIKRTDANRVNTAISEAGYVSDSNIPFTYCFFRIHHATYYHPQHNIPIEIHWNFGIPYFFKLTSDKIWDEVTLTDFGTLKLSPEMVIIMLLIHHHSHSFRELKILVDILWGLYRYDNKIDWYQFVHKLQNIGLIKSTQIALHQIQSLWEESSKKLISVQVLQQAIDNMGCRIPQFLVAYFQMNTDRGYDSHIYKDKLLARFALDRWSTTLLSYLKTLFPLPKAIKELYGDQRSWALPFHYLRFIKWRLKDWLHNN